MPVKQTRLWLTVMCAKVCVTHVQTLIVCWLFGPRLILVEIFFSAASSSRGESNVTLLRYQGTPNDRIAVSPSERQAFHKNLDKLYIF